MVRLVKWIVSQRILKKDKHAKIIFAGDFNQHLQDFGFLTRLGLTELVNGLEPTHNSGSKLDHVFTSLEILKCQLVEVPHCSDHSMIVATLKLNHSDVGPKFAS